MSYRNQLDSYIARLQRRLRLGAWLRGAAIFTGTALIVTVSLVLVLNRFAFPAHGVVLSRFMILAALAAAALYGMALPIMRLTEARATHHAEAAIPELEQRLTTFQERARGGSDPFLELLAAELFSVWDLSPGLQLRLRPVLFRSAPIASPPSIAATSAIPTTLLLRLRRASP